MTESRFASEVDGVPEVEYDHHSEEYGQRSLDMLRGLRSKCPVAHSSSHGGFWVLTKYEDVAAVARDDATFSSEHTVGDDSKQGITIPPSPIRSVPIEMDPPEFLKYRRLLNPFFSPAATEQWMTKIERWVTICLDTVIETGEFDIVLDLANPVPALFTCDFLGLPVEDWKKYADPAHESIYSRPGTPEKDRANAGWMWIMGSLADLVEQRRREPRDDMLTTLVNARVDGEPLADEMILEMGRLIIAGGFDTTTALVANALLYLDQNREARQQLIDRPEMMALAVEEFLRYFTPTQALARTVTEDTVVRGQPLSKGDRVMMSWASANHDEEMFENPDEIVLDRFPNRHTAFGLGAHRCLGSNLARAELALIIGEVLRRMPDYTVQVDRATRYPSIGTVNGWVDMPATFTPGTKVLPGERLPGA